jgi:hypothetical protein
VLFRQTTKSTVGNEGASHTGQAAGFLSKVVVCYHHRDRTQHQDGETDAICLWIAGCNYRWCENAMTNKH